MGQDEGAEPNSGHIAALTALRGLKIAMFMLAELGLCLSVSKLRGFTAIPGGLVQVKLWPGLLGWLPPLFLRWGRGTPSRHMALHVCFEGQRNWPDPGPTSLCQSLQDQSGVVLWEADGRLTCCVARAGLWSSVISFITPTASGEWTPVPYGACSVWMGRIHSTTYKLAAGS